MLEDAVVGETTNFAKIGGSPLHTTVLAEPCAPRRGYHNIVMPVSMQLLYVGRGQASVCVADARMPSSMKLTWVCRRC